jgi:hypothetical protein
MSYNGSGTFQINTSGQPVVTGTSISSTVFNALTADLATGLSTAITKDGQTTTTARIPFALGINSTLVTDATNTTSGSIITAGGVGIAKALFVGTTANVAGAVTLGGVATFSAQPIFSSLTASSAVATDASKGLVSVTNTGTGNNVLATTPTIATPSITSPTISDGTANGVAYLNGSKVLTTGSALVFDGTNLGVGVTPSAWGSTFRAMDVLGYASFSGYNNGEADMSCNGYYNSGWKYKNTAAATLYQQGAGTHAWYTAASGTAGNSISFTQAMTLDASGRLGIGTPTPSRLLEISDSTATTATLISFGINGGGKSILTGFISDGTNITNARIRTSASTPLSLGTTSSNDALWINNNGNIGIGTTTDSGYKLDVNGTGRFTGTTYFTGGSIQVLNSNASGYSVTTYASTGTSGKSFDIGVGGSTSAQPNRFYIYDNEADALRFYIASTGAATFSSSVTATAGIFNLNTTDGGFKVTAVAATPTTLSYLANNYFAKFYTRPDQNYGITIFDQNEATAIQSADLVNGTNARALILNPYGGNVGIGVAPYSTYPDSKLHVYGTRSNTVNAANAIAKIGGSDVYISFGALNGTPNYGTWIQALRPSDDVSFPLSLQSVGGNVLIGTTTDSSYKLDVNGTGRFYNTGGSNTLVVSGTGSPYKSILDLQYSSGVYGATLTYDANPEILTIENYGRTASGTTQGDINFRTKVNNTTPTDVLNIDGFTGAATFSSTVTSTKGYFSSNGATDSTTAILANASTNDSTSYAAIFGSLNAGYRMVVRADGNVGIGTTVPNSTLAVQGVISKYTTTGIDGTFDNIIKYGYYADLNTSGGANAARWIGIDGSVTAGGAVSNVLRIRAYGGGTGNSAPVSVADFRGDQTSYFYSSITVAGSITATADVTAYSDARLKENVITIDNALEKVKALRGVFYNRIDTEDKSRKVGVIAQEIQEVLPEVVSVSNDTLGVAYGNIVSVLIEAIKEQQTQIEELKTLVYALTK